MLLSLLLLSCTGTPPVDSPPSGELIFVRDGVIAPGGSSGQALADGRRFIARDWSPGESVTIDGVTGAAPARAECVPLFHVDLGDVSRLVAMGGAAPNTALAFSPDDGARLAVGSYRGELLIVDGWTGAVQQRKRLAETMIKQVTWSADGQTLYAAEQSPDANLYALDPATLSPKWTLRLADIVGTSSPPDGDDLYGIYSLPGVYTLKALSSGELLISALHSWTDAETEKKQNASQILRVESDGQILARWPEMPVSATFQHMVLDEAEKLAALTVNRSAAGSPPESVPIGGVQVLSLPDLTPMFGITAPPLEPWFRKSYIWNGLDISSTQRALYMGFGDGRVMLANLDGEVVLEKQLGAPVMAGAVPIHASVGWGFLHDGGVVFSTSKTLIPYGAASNALRPPTAHPNENTLWSIGADGVVRWSWTGSQQIEGLSLSDDRAHLLVGAGDRQTDDRRDLYGALVFDLGGPARSGEDRLEAFCPTAGPVFFRQRMAPDGRVAVSEHPYLEGDGTVKAAYQITVLR